MFVIIFSIFLPFVFRIIAREDRFHSAVSTMTPSRISLSSSSVNTGKTPSSASTSSTNGSVSDVESEGQRTPVVSIDGKIENDKALRSAVWKYATKVTPLLARCNQCGKEIKTGCGRTTSLRKYLSRQHHINDLLNKSVNKRQPKLDSISKHKKDRLDHLAKLAIIEDGRSFGECQVRFSLIRIDLVDEEPFLWDMYDT